MSLTSIPTRDLGFFVRNISSYLIEYKVFLIVYPFLPEKMHGRAPEIFLLQLSSKAAIMIMTLTVLAGC
jgi:hypothetical protein